MREDKNIYLIGFMGVGKSTVSRQLQKMLEWDEIDTDQYIVGRKKMAITDIFSAYGEAYFRTLETNILKDIAKEQKQIVSCGGGMALKQENQKIMKQSGTVILLTASPQTIYEHVKGKKERPLLNGHMDVDYIENLMKERETYYKEAADYELAVDGLTPEEAASQIIKLLNKEHKA